MGQYRMLKSKIIRIYVLKILFFLVCLQSLEVLSFGGFAIKYYHAFAVSLFPYLTRRKKISFVSKKISFFYIIITVVSAIAAPLFGISSFFFNYLFALYLIVLVKNIGYDFFSEDWHSVLTDAFIIVLSIVWIKNIIQYQAFIDFFRRPYGHPIISVFFGGGVNLEASYIALMCPIFFSTKIMWPFIISSIAIAILYASRTAIVINILVIVWIMFIKIDKKHWWKISIVIVASLVTLIIIFERGYLDYVVQRFYNIGHESGSIGRRNMWVHVDDIIRKYPFGVGIGNSIRALRKVSGIEFGEDNLHNLYMQMVVDLGFIGGLYYIGLVIDFLYKNRKRLKEPIVFVLVMYIVACLVQFRGAEAIIYFILAVYLKISHVAKKKIESSGSISNRQLR